MRGLNLVTRADQVTDRCLHINGPMRSIRHGIDENLRSRGMRQPRDFSDIEDRADRVRRQRALPRSAYAMRATVPGLFQIRSVIVL